MTGTVAYILAKKLIASEISSVTTGISEVTSKDGNLEFHLADGSILTVPIPENTGLMFITEGELPEQGKEDTLYIVGTTIQYWNGNGYVEISGGTTEPLVWEPMQ